MNENVKRLFAACPLPQPLMRELSDIVSPLRERLPGARFTQSRGWHITLAFLGNTDAALIPAVKSCLDEAATGVWPEAGRLGGLGHFGRRQCALLFCGISGASHLFRLSERFRRQMDIAGIAYDKKAFRPHITLARRADIRNIRLGEYEPGADGGMIDRAVLFESRLGREGPAYIPLHTVTLAPPDDR